MSNFVTEFAIILILHIKCFIRDFLGETKTGIRQKFLFKQNKVYNLETFCVQIAENLFANLDDTLKITSPTQPQSKHHP